jgi:hypothetical protein
MVLFGPGHQLKPLGVYEMLEASTCVACLRQLIGAASLRIACAQHTSTTRICTRALALWNAVASLLPYPRY